MVSYQNHRAYLVWVRGFQKSCSKNEEKCQVAGSFMIKHALQIHSDPANGRRTQLSPEARAMTTSLSMLPMRIHVLSVSMLSPTLA